MSLNGVNSVGSKSNTTGKTSENVTATLIQRSKPNASGDNSVSISKKEFSDLSKRLGVKKEDLTQILCNSMGVIKSDIDGLKSKHPKDIVIPPHKREAFNNFLEFSETNLVDKITTPNNLAFQVLGRENILGLKKPGESFERTIDLSIEIGANIGLAGSGDNEIKDLILGALDTEVGANGKIEVGISATVKATKEGSKVVLNFDIEGKIMGEVGADIKVMGQSVQDTLPGKEKDHGGKIAKAKVAKSSYQLTFKSEQDAIDFIESKGKGFSKVAKLNDPSHTGKVFKEIKKSDTLDETTRTKTSHKIVKKSTKSAIGMNSSISRQRLEKKAKIGLHTEEHSVSLETAANFVVGDKAKSGTSLTIINDKTRKDISGELKIDINLDKIRSSKDTEILLNKYFDRLDKVVSKSNKEGTYDIPQEERDKIKSHITTMISDLVNTYKQEDGSLSIDGQSKNVDKYFEQTSVDISGSIPVAPAASVTLGVAATMGKVFTFTIPLEQTNKGDIASTPTSQTNAPGGRSITPKLGLSSDPSKLVFLKDTKALSLSAGVTAGYAVLSVGGGATIGGSQERSKAIHQVT